ncbi:pseudouridine synthase [Naematelia encephala]|uniref:Pseudouridine synthase n=1 Tax=Naematelia encephala TaxID=71784 RepID=A0A1Y2AM17_9TREE|nr:pseudouridine synthase [Naematelia encephala]
MASEVGEKRQLSQELEEEDFPKRARHEIEANDELKLEPLVPAVVQDTINGEIILPPPTDAAPIQAESSRASWRNASPPISRLGLKAKLPEMPSSLQVVLGAEYEKFEHKGEMSETDVGIIGYAGKPVQGVKGVIKQRFTDFLVNEVVPNGQVLHLKNIGKPVEPVEEEKPDKGKEKAENETDLEATPLPDNLNFEPIKNWTTTTTRQLRPHLSDETIISLHSLLVEGRDPPPKSDSGWGSRQPKAQVEETEEENAMNAESSVGNGGRGQGRDRGRGRGRGRGGRGGGRAGDDKWWAANTDDREVVSQPITGKEERTAAHQAIRELFKGLFESSSKDSPEGSRLVIKWSRGNARRYDAGNKRKLPDYIHFTLQKANRETQDALGHIGRLLQCHSKDLSVCGTKDKRAVTVQRVCLRRGNRNLVQVWKAVNGLKMGRRTEQTAVTERAERGTRIGDLEYSDRYLELGMLKGNHFLITLRNVQAESEAAIDEIMSSVRDHGFINFYGMQRFGTSAMPTHVTGLYMLRSQWAQAVDSILCLREGEHPDCMRGRLAWLEDGDYEKALELMPRRCVAERCIWESWKRQGRIEDKLGALSSIPRNLRTMYVHAYQSYIWNLAVSERIKLSSTSPLVGDLVIVAGDEEEVPPAKGDGKRKWETTSSQEVKELAEGDLANHTIFDVVMPLPGWNVDYPGGEIGELYGKIMKADGLDPQRMRRDQRDYSLPGSYRRMINHPTHVSWKHTLYTDPDLALVQTDEDKILGLNPPVESDPNGKFRALSIELTLGSSAYATMALREVTRDETSTWHQTGLTMTGEDQEYKGAGNIVEAEEEKAVDELEEGVEE